MSLESIISEAISKVVANLSVMTITEGVVIDVDKAKYTCNIERDNLPELFDVRLNAVVSATGTLTIFPTPGSKVLCAIVENNPNDAYVLTCTDVEEIVFDAGINGGLVIAQQVADQLQAIKDDLNSLKTAFNTWIAIPGDGGGALKTAATSWSGQQLAVVDPLQLQNIKIKH